MAGRGTSILWFVVKWLVIPVGLAGLGYFIISSRAGTATDDAPNSSDEGSHSAANGSAQRVSHTEPQVEIESREVNPRKRTNKLRPKPKPEQDEEHKTAPETEPGDGMPPLTNPVEPPTGGGGGDGAGLGG